MTKWLDMPPLWLAAFIALAWAQVRYCDAGLGCGPVVGDLLGGLLIGGGVVLMAMAFAEFRRHATTVIPHRDAAHLIQSGIFKHSRNPIYLADAMILAGVIFWWGAVLSLPLVPVFVWILEKRFILPEENSLRRIFRADFARYCQKTRRWV